MICPICKIRHGSKDVQMVAKNPETGETITSSKSSYDVDWEFLCCQCQGGLK